MSYCRFSCMDFACDIYAYEGPGAYVIHVAKRRVVGEIPTTPCIMSTPPEVYVKAHRAQMDFLETATREKIDLPHAGESFYEPDAEAFHARLVELRDLGYRFPAYVLDTVLAEIDAMRQPLPISPQEPA